MRIVWSERALSDLSEIEAYIARDNPTAGLAVKQHIMTQVRGLAAMPLMGRPGRVHESRELVITRLPYLVAYRVLDNRAEILAVIHGARQWPEAF